MFPEGTPEQDLLEALLEIERKPPDERTPEEAAQMEVVAAWFTDAGHVWGCPRNPDVWKEAFCWRRQDWTIAQRDHAIRVVRAARFAFVLASVPRERVSAYRFDGMERWFFMRVKQQMQS